MKASDVFMTVAAYQMLAEQTDAPFHLGITEAGGFVGGTVKSAIGLGNLLGRGSATRCACRCRPIRWRR
jgi:(E)-4-hydroxy-3-methylbut-2-enyl-diphosphate synthase